MLLSFGIRPCLAQYTLSTTILKARLDLLQERRKKKGFRVVVVMVAPALNCTKGAIKLKVFVFSKRHEIQGLLT